MISGTESCGHDWCSPASALGSTLFHISINLGGGTQHALGDPFKGTSAGWRNRQTRTSGKESTKSYTWGGITPCSSTGWGVTGSREGHQADHTPSALGRALPSRGRRFFPSAQPWWGTNQVLGPVLGSPAQYGQGHPRVIPARGHKGD